MHKIAGPVAVAPEFKRMLFCAAAALAFLILLAMPARAQDVESEQPLEQGSYLINAGDGLSLQVWNEPTLSAVQLLVRPDGFISVPVIGEIKAGGKTVAGVQEAIKEGLGRYLKDVPSVVINVIGTAGSQFYVLGKVARPGAFPLRGPIDITQALSIAGGLNSFAAENKIKVLRRDEQGAQKAIRFKYGDVKDGDRLATNILLKSGDVILVP